mmetsp:Transcript_9125/g.23853  ORF Transcript_9125/g.23853 Transcript_9125/m.23853 type:complete len:216 (+) Transcript_9125:253-900(+)
MAPMSRTWATPSSTSMQSCAVVRSTPAGTKRRFGPPRLPPVSTPSTRTSSQRELQKSTAGICPCWGGGSPRQHWRWNFSGDTSGFGRSAQRPSNNSHCLCVSPHGARAASEDVQPRAVEETKSKTPPTGSIIAPLTAFVAPRRWPKTPRRSGVCWSHRIIPERPRPTPAKSCLKPVPRPASPEASGVAVPPCGTGKLRRIESDTAETEPSDADER